MKFIAVIVAVLMMLVVVVVAGAHVAAQRDCATYCPQNFDPICGYNGECYLSFGNLCELRVEECTSGKKFESASFNECDKSDARLCS